MVQSVPLGITPLLMWIIHIVTAWTEEELGKDFIKWTMWNFLYVQTDFVYVLIEGIFTV